MLATTKLWLCVRYTRECLFPVSHLTCPTAPATTIWYQCDHGLAMWFLWINQSTLRSNESMKQKLSIHALPAHTSYTCTLVNAVSVRARALGWHPTEPVHHSTSSASAAHVIQRTCDTLRDDWIEWYSYRAIRSGRQFDRGAITNAIARVWAQINTSENASAPVIFHHHHRFSTKQVRTAHS